MERMIRQLVILFMACTFACLCACSGNGGKNDAGDADALDGDGAGDLDETEGELVWVRRAGGSRIAWPTGVAAADRHDSVVAGFFVGDNLVFGSGEPNQTSLSSAGDQDLFLARFTEDGSILWARRAGGPGMDLAMRVVACPDGTFLLGSLIHQTAVFGPGEAGETLVTAQGAPDLVLARYAGNGDLVSVRQAAAMQLEIPTQLAPCGAPLGLSVQPDGSVWVASYFNTTITLGPGQAGERTLAATGNRDMYLARFDSDGQLLASARAGGPGETFAQAATVLPDGSCVVTGGFSDSATFGQGEANQTILVSVGYFDVFVARYQPDGRLAWARRAGGGPDTSQWGAALTTLPDGSVLAVGDFNGITTFGPGETNQTVLEGDVMHSMFLAKYAQNGDLAWARQAHGSARGYDVTSGPGGFLVAAKFFDTIVLGRGEENETEFFAESGADVLVARYDLEGRLLWARHDGGPGLDMANGVLMAPDGFNLVIGGFEDRIVFGTGEENQQSFRALGDWDLFLMKLGP